MIAVDASVLIPHLDAQDAQHSQATDLLARYADDGFAASELTIAEVLVGPARTGRLDDAVIALDALGIEIVAHGSDAASRLAVLRATTNLKLPDCCVLLIAGARSAAVATFGHRLAAAARALGHRVVP